MSIWEETKTCRFSIQDLKTTKTDSQQMAWATFRELKNQQSEKKTIYCLLNFDYFFQTPVNFLL